MALDGSLASKSARENADFEVAAPVARSGVSRMTAAVVHDLELVGVECFLKSASNQRDALGRHISYRCRCRDCDPLRAT